MIEGVEDSKFTEWSSSSVFIGPLEHSGAHRGWQAARSLFQKEIDDLELLNIELCKNNAEDLCRIQSKYDEAVKDIKWALDELDIETTLEPENSYYKVNIKNIRQKHGLKDSE